MKVHAGMKVPEEATSARMRMKTVSPRLIVSETANGQWRSVLDTLGGNLYHSEEWAEISRSGHTRPIFFHWIDGRGRSAGIAVGIESRSPIPYVGRFSRRLNLESYPAVRNNDPELARLLIKQTVAFAKNEGYRTLSLQSYCTDMLIPDLAQMGFAASPRAEFILDLTRSTDALWKGISDHHRRKIRKAGKQGLVMKETCSPEAMEQLILLLGSTSERRNSRGDNMALFEKAFYEEMGKKLFSRGLGKLYLMMHGGEPVSAAFVTLYAGRAFYLWGGTAEKGYAMNAPSLLFWNIFLRCRETGCTQFNMGGVSAEAEDAQSPARGLFRFKSAFGGRMVRCVSGTIDNLQAFRGFLLAVAEKGRTAFRSVTRRA